MPVVESALRAALLVERQQILDVRVGDGPAVGAARERRAESARAGASSARPSAGTTKMRRRLGVSPGAFAPYGPLIVTSDSAGSVPRPRIRGRSVASSRTSSRSMNVTPTSRGPALTGMRNSSGLSGSGSPVLRLRRPRARRRPAAVFRRP